jgi:hypothetical protein
MSKNTRKTLGAAQLVAVAGIAVGALLMLTVANLPRNASNTSITVKKKNQLVLSGGRYLDVLGLSPDALAAAGVTSQQAGVIATNLQDYLDGDGSGLQDAIDAWGAANRDADMARRAVQSGKGDVETASSLNSALASALAAKNSAINATVAAAAGQLDNSVLEALARIKANRHQNVPVQYLVIDRTAEQWRQLRDALSQKKFRDSVGAGLDADAAAIISDADADTAVSTAVGRVVSNLAAIKAAMQ